MAGDSSPTSSGSPGSSTHAAVNVGRSRDCSIVRVEGRGTMRQSPAVHQFISRLLDAGAGSAVLDLTACTYLDSTFLGCLLDLHKRFGTGSAPRLTIAMHTDGVRRLFGPTGLQKVLHVSPDCPPNEGAWLPLATDGRDAMEVAQHVMKCHQLLAEMEGPQQAIFARIADQMARDIARGVVDE